jgi:hypothetical protein
MQALNGLKNSDENLYKFFLIKPISKSKRQREKVCHFFFYNFPLQIESPVSSVGIGTG